MSNECPALPFQGCLTPEEVKVRYRELCKVLHPDCGGSNEAFNQMYQAYKVALKSLDKSSCKGTDGQTHTYNFNEALEAEIHEVVNKLLALKIPQLDIFVIGAWIWLAPSPETKPFKDELKAIGMSWNHTRDCWCWKPSWYRRSTKSSDTLAGLGKKYGARHFDDEARKREIVKAS